MQIKIERAARLSLSEFADQHGLTMRLVERDSRAGDSMRWSAAFEHAEVKDGAMLASVHGNGSTPDGAMRSYARAISHKCLIVGAYTSERRELYTPELF